MSNNSFDNHDVNRGRPVIVYRYDPEYHRGWSDIERRGACGALVEDMVSRARLSASVNANVNTNANTNANASGSNDGGGNGSASSSSNNNNNNQFTISMTITNDEIEPRAVHTLAGVTLWLIPVRVGSAAAVAGAADINSNTDNHDDNNDNNHNDNQNDNQNDNSPPTQLPTPSPTPPPPSTDTNTRTVTINLLEPSVLAFLRKAAFEVGCGWCSMNPIGPDGNKCNIVFLKDG